MMSATIDDDDGRTAPCSTAMVSTAELQGERRYENRINNNNNTQLFKTNEIIR